jgi:hypothetical protein
MNDLTTWWNGLGEEVQWAIRDGIVVVVGLCLGFMVGRIAKGMLVRRGVDRYLRAPWTKPEDAEQQFGTRREPSLLASVVGWLFTLTVWAGGACIIGWLRRIDPLIDFAQVAVTRGWQVAIVILSAVLASGWLAHTVYGLFQTPWLKRELDALFTPPGKGEGSFSDTAARGICVFIYAAFLLLVPVAIAGLFNLATFAPLVAPAWHLCARLLTVPAAFAVGYLGLAWVRSQGKALGKEGVDHSELEYYVGLGIMVGTIVFALALLLGVSSGAGAVAMVALVGFLVFLFWPIRKNMRDIWAGVMLRLQAVQLVPIDGAVHEVQSVGLLMATVARRGEVHMRRNTEVLACALKTPEKPESSPPALKGLSEP